METRCELAEFHSATRWKERWRIVEIELPPPDAFLSAERARRRRARPFGRGSAGPGGLASGQRWR
eukprot:12004017-Alexandrium_andersonii.AAC.1